jgi:hypothetical protein
MRLRISLFDVLLLVIPACAVALGLLVASIKSSEPYLLTIAQSVYLVAMLAAICALFQRQPGVRVIGGAFLAASLGHLLLLHLANQSNHYAAFPTTYALGKIWENANPGQAVFSPYTELLFQGGGTSLPVVSGSGYSGGMYGGGPISFGSTVPVYQYPVGIHRPLFVDVGVWAISLLLGVL